MFETAISLRDMGLFLFFTGLLVALVYLIVTLKRLADLLVDVRKIVHDNEKAVQEFFHHAPRIADNTAYISESLRSSVQQSENSLPQILRNVEGITGSANSSIKNIDASIASVGSGIDRTVTAVQDSSTDLAAYLGVLAEAAKVILSLLAKPKKRRRKK